MRTLLPGLLAALLNILFIPVIITVARKKNWYDKPDPRKIHTHQISRLGGVGIFWALMGTVLLSLSVSQAYRDGIMRYWPVLLAMLVVHLLGLLDDFLDLRARLRFFVQLGAAIFVVTFGYRFTHLWLPGLGSLNLGWVSSPITILWIVGVLNALNMIDGLDGLSGGISMIAVFGFGIILMERQAVFPALLALCLAGSLAGYLFYNFPPAKIFMGDSGSTFLGFSLAVLPLLDFGHASDGLWFWAAVTLLLIPIFDVFAAMLRRKRNGVPMMSPDKWHIHHKLMHFGMGNRTILAIIYSMCTLLAIAAVSMLFLPPFWFWLVILLSWGVVSTFFLVLHYAKERSLRKAKTAS